MSSTATLPSIHLFYKAGTSDKEYKVEILSSDADGFKVAYHYGKRGSKLRSGFKNSTPVDFDTAKRIYDEVVSGQLKDGYKPSQEPGTEYTIPEEMGKSSGIFPQLLNKISDESVEQYLSDDAWVMQQKFDGQRCMIRKRGKLIEAINKKGLIVSLPTLVEEAIKAIVGRLDCVVDGEIIGEKYHMFDMLQIGVHAVAISPYEERLVAMEEWGFVEAKSDNFTLVPTAVGKASKKAMYKRLKEENAEGVVFKRLSSVYTAGKPASGGDQVKKKFNATGHFRVRKINTKRSVEVEVLDKGDWISVGDVTIPVNHEVPSIGKVVDVQYLYAFPGGSLFQTVYLGQRKDVYEDECLKSQLKYKQGTTEEEEE